MSKKLLILIMLILCLNLILLKPVSSSSDDYQITVIRVKGEAKKLESGVVLQLMPEKGQEISKGDTLKPGDKIKTGDDSFIDIYFENKTAVRIEENTEVKIKRNRPTDKGTASGVEMKRGRIWVKVKEVWEGITKFEVITPSAITGVKGTEFMVESEEEKTSLSVREGKVEFLGRERKKEITVKKGEFARVEKGKMKGPESLPAHVEDKWEKEKIKEWLEEMKEDIPAEHGLEQGPENKDEMGNSEQGSDKEDEGKEKGEEKKEENKPEDKPGEANNENSSSEKGK